MLSGYFPVSIPLFFGTPYHKKTEFRVSQPLYLVLNHTNLFFIWN